MSLTLQPGSPRVISDGDNKEYEYVYKCDKGTGESYIPARLSVGPEGTGYLQRAQVVSDIGYDTVTLTYSADIPDGGQGGIKDGKTISNITSNVFEKDLSEHPLYLYNWDHYLVRKSTGSLTVEAAKTAANWVAAVNDTIIDGADELKWIHKSESVPTGFKKMTDIQKPKVDAFYYPAAEITEEYYFKRKSKAEEKIKGTGNRATPEDIHGVTGAEWLVIGCSVNQDGKYWVCKVTYQSAHEWDHDLYSEA